MEDLVDHELAASARLLVDRLFTCLPPSRGERAGSCLAEAAVSLRGEKDRLLRRLLESREDRRNMLMKLGIVIEWLELLCTRRRRNTRGQMAKSHGFRRTNLGVGGG